MNTFFNQLLSATKSAFPKAGKTIWWLLKIIIPISFLVSLLQFSGLLSMFAVYMSPLFSLIGLPGESAIVFISSMFLSLYAPIAIIATLPLDIREISILALMCLVSHNLIVETAVQRKTGSSGLIMFSLRFVSSFILAFILHKILPDQPSSNMQLSHEVINPSFSEMLSTWLWSSFDLILKIVLIVTGLMIMQQILKEFKLLDKVAAIFSPLMKFMGLSADSAFLWFVAQTVGLAYGSAIMTEAVHNNEISPRNANLLNFHIAINHSLLEDTLLFVAIGVPAAWIVFPRLLWAIVVVWIVRLWPRRKLL
ncbi:MAG: nucleoside recognition protein [Paludibacteraceae bacterium]|nr:nucleoside recognition protein [Paludibacteraceae bacterium]